MPTDILTISDIVNWMANFLALAVGILYCYRNSNPRYLWIFPVYLFISLMVELLVNSYFIGLLHIRPFGTYQPYAKLIIYNLYTPFELFVFSWFLFRIIQSPLIKRLLILSLMLFSLFFIISSSNSHIAKSININSVILECIIIIIPCFSWYRELFTRDEPVNLIREPAFWLVTGIFFYLATIIPLIVTRTYLITHGMAAAARSLFSINNFSLVITYLLFIKGFTCRIRRS